MHSHANMLSTCSKSAMSAPETQYLSEGRVRVKGKAVQYLALGCRLQRNRVTQGSGGEAAPPQGQLIKAGGSPAQLLTVLLQQSLGQLHHCCCFLRSACTN